MALLAPRSVATPIASGVPTLGATMAAAPNRKSIAYSVEFRRSSQRSAEKVWASYFFAVLLSCCCDHLRRLLSMLCRRSLSYSPSRLNCHGAAASSCTHMAASMPARQTLAISRASTHASAEAAIFKQLGWLACHPKAAIGRSKLHLHPSSATSPSASSAPSSGDTLSDFLGWAVANGEFPMPT